jgi:hypothetical protein
MGDLLKLLGWIVLIVVFYGLEVLYNVFNDNPLHDSGPNAIIAAVITAGILYRLSKG